MSSFGDGCFLSRNFYVVVVPLKRKSGTIKNLINPDEMDMEEVRCVKNITFQTWCRPQWFWVDIFVEIRTFQLS